MSFTVTASAEELAKLFHHYQEALAGDFDCVPANGRAASWEKTPQNERDLRVAAVRMALLEADVNFKVARDFIERVKAKSIGAEVVQSIQPGQQIVKIINDELVESYTFLISTCKICPETNFIKGFFICGLLF